ncbi:MAG: TMEM14 family protein [Verrucomicrobia bacterium]|nr:TMEM14 family protein [Verrucomicrobiota bacterium]
MIAETVLWIYIVLLIAGGVAGMVNGKSKATLVAAVAFAVSLCLCALRVLPYRWTSWMLLALLVVFAVQLGRTRKFMPAGLMLILTALALALPHLPFR